MDSINKSSKSMKNQYNLFYISFSDESFLSQLVGNANMSSFSRFLETVCYATKLDLNSLQLLVRAALNGVIPPTHFAHFCDNIAQRFIQFILLS